MDENDAKAEVTPSAVATVDASVTAAVDAYDGAEPSPFAGEAEPVRSAVKRGVWTWVDGITLGTISRGGGCAGSRGRCRRDGDGT